MPEELKETFNLCILCTILTNNIQRELTAKYLFDISKAVATVFMVGAFIPNSPIRIPLIGWGYFNFL